MDDLARRARSMRARSGVRARPSAGRRRPPRVRLDQTVSRIERGHFESLSLERSSRVARGPRGPDRARPLVARAATSIGFATAEPCRAWSSPSFASSPTSRLGGPRRGLLQPRRRARLHRHPRLARRRRKSLLVVEVKTEIVDVGEMLGTLDRKRRLGPDDRPRARAGRPLAVSCALIVRDATRTIGGGSPSTLPRSERRCPTTADAFGRSFGILPAPSGACLLANDTQGRTLARRSAGAEACPRARRLRRQIHGLKARVRSARPVSVRRAGSSLPPRANDPAGVELGRSRRSATARSRPSSGPRRRLERRDQRAG